jgi:hypothetical protein
MSLSLTRCIGARGAEEFAALLHFESARYAKVVREAGIKGD